MRWRGAGIIVAVGAIALVGIVALPDRDEADTVAPVRIAKASQTR